MEENLKEFDEKKLMNSKTKNQVWNTNNRLMKKD